MSCKNKNNSNKNKDKKIVCNSCECTYDDDNKLKVTCTKCEDGNDKTIICKSCNLIDNDENNKKEVCLKECSCNGSNEDTIYITCAEYKEDLD
ncbi:MAG: hypothetical protein J6J17_01190 [Bacilli bacterium]|nr:hypothetical protein [Bacilli bacterium]